MRFTLVMKRTVTVTVAVLVLPLLLTACGDDGDDDSGDGTADESETMPPEQQEASNLIYRKILDLEAQEAMMQAQQQAMMAADLGMGNAAQPQGPPSMPDMPKLGQGSAGPGPATPNQPPSQSTPS